MDSGAAGSLQRACLLPAAGGAIGNANAFCSIEYLSTNSKVAMRAPNLWRRGTVEMPDHLYLRPMPSFFSELRRRNVLRVAAAYALVAWIIIEAGSVLLPTFGATDTVFQVYVLVVLLGFLVSLVFAWIFEITPEGVKLDRDVDRRPGAPTRTGRLTNYAFVGLLIVALGVSITFNVTGVRGTPDSSAAEIMQGRQSIAVLPFVSRSTDPENALFSDGVHDDLLTRLANVSSLRVISRTSVMEYRDTTKNLREIGRELGVDTLLEGTVQRVGDQVRINVQLIDADTDEHLWARVYDREVTTDNLFAVQTEVSAQIAAALQTTLMPEPARQAAEIPTTNLRAYSLYTSGRDNLYVRQLAPLQEARQQFQQAIELDPEYAQAHAALAEAYILLAINHQAMPVDEALQTAEAHLETAIALDPELSDAYAALGLLKTSSWSRTRLGTENLEAEAAFEQALALNPSNARAYMWFANLRDAENRTDEAIGYYHRSMQLDPLGRVPYNNLPTLYAQRGENEYAIRLWLDAIELHPDWSAPYQLLAAQLAGMGRLDEALAWNRLALEKTAEAERFANLSAGIYLQFGDLERALQAQDRMTDDHPLSPLKKGLELILRGSFAEASEEIVEVLESGEDLPQFADAIAAQVALMAGDLEAAKKYLFRQNPVLQLDAALEINRFTVSDVVKLAYIHQQEGDTARGQELLQAALPVVQSLPRLGIFGQGVREAQIYALLGQHEDAYASLREAIDAGYRSSILYDQWLLQDDPYLASMRDDARFVSLLRELDDLNSVMYQRVLAAEAANGWQELRNLASAG